jgi:hypothetical protein
MTVDATNVVAPVLTTPEVVALLSTGMAAQTRLGDFLRRFVLERNHLGRITFFNVSLPWTVTRFATRHFLFPAFYVCEFCMRCMRKGLELVFVTVLTGIAADIVIRFIAARVDLNGWRWLRRAARSHPGNGCTQSENYDDFKEYGACQSSASSIFGWNRPTLSLRREMRRIILDLLTVV